MKIGVLSDTHLSSQQQAQELAEGLLAGPFKEIEAIIHAGDVVTAELERCFYPLPWYSVRGNMDLTLTEVPFSRVLILQGTRIGIIHGWGGHADLEQRVIASFAEQQLDVLIYGHSHRPVCHHVGALLVMNPGSATDRRKAPRHTVGLLNLNGVAAGEIIVID